MTNRPSVRDVAALAGTSTAVVSYVLNNGPRPVSAAARLRVEEAIETLGYRPNRLARGLRTKRTATIGLVIPDLARPFFAQLAAAIEDAALQRHQHLFISATRFSADRELAQLQALLDAAVDGVILAPTEGHLQPVKLLADAQVPHVITHHHSDDVTTVVADDRLAGLEATNHLVEHGHRYIACLTGPISGSPIQARTAGFREALAAASHPVEEDLILPCGYEHLADSAYLATRELLARRPDVTAICATTDEHGLGVVRAAHEAGRKIGVDLALITIDGTVQSEYLTPPMTVVRVPFAALGTATVDQLLRQIGGEAPTKVAPLRCSLIRHQSCGCPT
ncbi:MAG TPA: LacI family DNA-binding transcriptional regulator [Candidatus Nanopelagicaceae bacterium]|nr:LacI family DNA-binding transcriptional regulator [Candidatus Nanopelagicaceae bacterium]